MTRDENGLKQLPILAVDDDEANLLLLRRTLERAGHERVETTRDPRAAMQIFGALRPELVLLDLHMPRIDGFQLMQRLGPVTAGGTGVPLLVLTADTTPEVKRRALAAGARDFLTKPLDQTELLLRVRNLLMVQQLQTRLHRQNASLEDAVAERTRELDQARIEILERLALAAEYRDDDTQQHARRIGRMSGLLARALSLPARQVELIRRAAPLHDIGKIGVRDAVLLKPGKLTPDERDEMKAHTTIGAEILSGSRSPLLRLAEEIALTHHERWDGDGYPRGVAGDDIPVAGRIVALADVFDALTHRRPYKQAWPLDEALAEVRDQAGCQFDPAVVAAMGRIECTPPVGRRPRIAPQLLARM